MEASPLGGRNVRHLAWPIPWQCSYTLAWDWAAIALTGITIG
ncbi:hypothetical protein AB0442_41255 [Kitasatospora sp. NPDC085895]